MDTNNIIDFASRDASPDALTQLLRTGAQQLIATAVEAELESFLVQFATARTPEAFICSSPNHPSSRLRNSRVADIISFQADVDFKNMWLLLSTSLNSASGILEANSRPCDTGCSASPLA